MKMGSGKDRNTEGQDIGAPLSGVDSIEGVVEGPDTGPPFRVAFTIQGVSFRYGRKPS